jgi:hypothetical protein
MSVATFIIIDRFGIVWERYIQPARSGDRWPLEIGLITGALGRHSNKKTGVRNRYLSRIVPPIFVIGGRS